MPTHSAKCPYSFLIFMPVSYWGSRSFCASIDRCPTQISRWLLALTIGQPRRSQTAIFIDTANSFATKNNEIWFHVCELFWTAFLNPDVSILGNCRCPERFIIYFQVILWFLLFSLLIMFIFSRHCLIHCFCSEIIAQTGRGRFSTVKVIFYSKPILYTPVHSCSSDWRPLGRGEMEYDGRLSPSDASVFRSSQSKYNGR
jgi:hypothetical protein